MTVKMTMEEYKDLDLAKETLEEAKQIIKSGIHFDEDCPAYKDSRYKYREDRRDHVADCDFEMLQQLVSLLHI